MKNLRNKNQPPLAGLVQEYIDSAYDVIYAVYQNLESLVALGDAVIAGGLDGLLAETDIDTLAKLNAILTDANLLDEGSIVKLPFATQGEAEGGIDNEHAMTPLRTAQAIATFAATVPNNYNGAGPPGVNDDVTQGWMAGSVWIDQLAVPPESYRCSSNLPGEAIWLLTTLTADELATVALTGVSDDLTEGASKLLMTTAERAKLAAIEAGATDDMTPAEIAAAYATVVPQVSTPEKAAGTATALRTYSPADIKGMAVLHGMGTWQESTTSFSPVKGSKWIYRGTGGHAATLEAVYTPGDSPAEIWIQHNGSGVFSITPASGDNLIVSGVTLAANISYILPIGTMAIIFPGVTNTTWLVTVISMSGGLTGLFKTSNYLTAPGDIVFVDSSVGPLTMTLPPTPTTGNCVVVMDAANNATANPITVARNGSTIDGAASDFIIDVAAGRVDFTYSGSTWEYRHDFSVDDDLTEEDIVDAVANSAQLGLPSWGFRFNLQASSWYDGTTPADFGVFTRVESAVGGAMYGYRTASGTVDQEAQASVFMNARYDVDTIGFKFEVDWLPTTTGAGNVKFEISAVGYAPDDEITKTFVVGATVVDACQLSTTKVHRTPLSAAFTFTEAQLPPTNGISHWRIRRLATDPEDTYASDIRIFGVFVHASSRANNDNVGNDF